MFESDVRDALHFLRLVSHVTSAVGFGAREHLLALVQCAMRCLSIKMSIYSF
jgi:hypothetical protein